MQREHVPSELTQQAFEFFYWFSRFESALKEAGYLKQSTPGAVAQPGWDQFALRWQQMYELSVEARELLALAPETQVVSCNGNLDWRPTRAVPGASDLKNVVLLLKTVRNNLFHGGKHGVANWSEPKRTEQLLRVSQAVLNQLAHLARMDADYKCRY